MKRFLIGYALLTTCLLFMQRSIIDEQQKPLLVYHADSKYAITGKVEEKRKIGSLFTITVNGNVFVVSEERYKNIEVGEEVKFWKFGLLENTWRLQGWNIIKRHHLKKSNFEQKKKLSLIEKHKKEVFSISIKKKFKMLSG